jgi:hypothetical protein
LHEVVEPGFSKAEPEVLFFAESGVVFVDFFQDGLEALSSPKFDTSPPLFDRF